MVLATTIAHPARKGARKRDFASKNSREAAHAAARLRVMITGIAIPPPTMPMAGCRAAPWTDSHRRSRISVTIGLLAPSLS
jgi:hypothetical protein